MQPPDSPLPSTPAPPRAYETLALPRAVRIRRTVAWTVPAVWSVCLLAPALVAIAFGLFVGDRGACDPSDEIVWGPIALGLVFLAPAGLVGTVAVRRLLQPGRAVAPRTILLAQLAHIPLALLVYAVAMFAAFGG